MNLNEIKEKAGMLSCMASQPETKELAFLVQMLAHRVEEQEMEIATKQDDPKYVMTAEQAKAYISRTLSDFPLGSGKSKLRLAAELYSIFQRFLGHNA